MRHLVILSMVALCAVGAAGAQASPQPSSDVAAIRRLDSLWAQMYARRDTVLARSLYAEDLVFTSANGNQKDREQELADGASAAPAPWYRRVRTLDLTGEGKADSIRLEAVGSRPDSLRITLSLLIDGLERHREAWGSSYELALLDSTARVSPRARAVVRAKLDTVLASVVVERLDAAGVRLMAEDSAVLSGLEPRPTHRVSFSYGYETTVRLLWDAPRQRFVRLFSCC